MLRSFSRWLSVTILVAVTAFSVPTAAEPGVANIALSGIGGTASPGGLVGYALSITNRGAGAATITATLDLPESFSYRPGTSVIQIDGQPISSREPSLAGRTLTWPGFDLPGANYISTSKFGIHTMVQDLCLESYIDFQLDKALALVGEGGYVKQTFYSLKSSTTGPKNCWAYFVNGAYARRLTPIVRLQGEYDGSKGYWVKPQADASGGYATIAAAYRRVVEGLPRRAGQPLYVEIWNEPELPVSWSNTPSAAEYGRFFVDVAATLHAIGDPRIRVLNGALTPGNAVFAEQLMRIPGFVGAFDAWAAHCYPYNHPPQYNVHEGSARYSEYAIDSYLLELSVVARYGRPGVHVILTETGHGLGDNIFAFEGYPAINETNRADYMARAFRDYWPRWPELQAACPFELVGPYGDWGWLDWLYPTTDIPHAQYTTVAALPKPPLLSQPVTATITFRAQAAALPGLYYSTLAATVDGQAMPPLLQAAPVRVIHVAARLSFPLILRSSVLQEIAPFVASSHPPGREGAAAGIPSYALLAASATGRQALDGSAARIIPLRGAGLAVTVDDTGARAYVSRPGQQLDTLDLATGAVERTLALPADLDLLASDASGQLAGIHIGDDQLFWLDAGTGRTTGTRMAGCGPLGIAIDARRGKIFVACAGDGSVVVLDRGLRPTARAAITGGPVLAVAVDPDAGRLYVVQPIVPGRHGIVMLDEDRLEPLARWGGGYEQPLGGMYALAVQPGSGRLVTGDRNALWGIDPGRLSLQLVRRVQTIVPRGSLVFTPDGKQLLALDGASLRVFDADHEGVH